MNPYLILRNRFSVKKIIIKLNNNKNPNKKIKKILKKN